MLVLGVKSETGFQKFSWNEETKISIGINRYESILAAWNDCSIERVSPSLQPFPRCVADSGGGARRKSTSERLKRTNFVRQCYRLTGLRNEIGCFSVRADGKVLIRLSFSLYARWKSEKGCARGGRRWQFNCIQCKKKDEKREKKKRGRRWN